MVVAANDWVLITAARGILKCVCMRRDIERTFNLPRIGALPVRLLLGAEMNRSLVLKSGVLEPSSELPSTSKHLLKKQKKTSPAFQLTSPNLPDLLSMYIEKNALPLSHEALAQILFHSAGYERVAVLDEYSSLVLGGVATARGTAHLYRIGGHCLEIHTLGALGHRTSLEAFSPLSFPAEGEKGSFLFVLAPRGSFSVPETVFLLKSAPGDMAVDFLLYHPAKEGLLPLFNVLMTEPRATLLDLRESFSREYQTRLGAIHPEMTKIGHSGFILTGTFLNTHLG
ncbi:hypothetical protein NEDG_00507 [Nematocida displodere]|uniref:tRNA (adenine(58)-N(1))-methyltransferase non-catalytic subunit TRM6 n=1 Tax=Nematocida displodere TaxID=1805483 RepID=A0A177ELP8_9MICR|nr:hypothetical protein NEDG_00507 [Nematocida displodere]